MRPKYLVTLLVLLALAAPVAPSHASGIVGDCDEAHLLAALAGGGTVTFSCSGTIPLTATIMIAADTTIDGSGQAVTISGNDAVRVLSVPQGVTLNLNRLTIANGKGDSDCGGIYNAGGTVTLSSSTFTGNRVNAATYGASGGAVCNYHGALTVTNSTFSHNTAVVIDGRGGGVLNADEGVLIVSNSAFADNGAHWGGGIANSLGTVTVSNSSFTGNSGISGGGGIDNNYGVVTVSNSSFAGNSGLSGGIFNVGTFGLQTVSNDSLFRNTADHLGGDISNVGSSGVLTVTSSTFSHNTSDHVGGGIGSSGGKVTVSDSTFSGNNARYGGGVGSDGAAVIVRSSTFSANSVSYTGYPAAGGGIYSNGGTVAVSNSTFTGNSSGYAGGGLGNTYGMVTVSNSSFSGNSALDGGGIHTSDGALTLKSTLVANSPGGGNCVGAVTDGGWNLSYPDATCPGINADPLLDPMQNNGGPTQTHALLPGSPAIDAGDPAGCTDPQGNPLSTDQRGFARFGRCDIGAYELQPIGFSTKVADHSMIFAGDSVGYTITLTNGGVSPISSARFTDTLPASFAYIPGSLTATGGTPGYLNGVITWEGQIAAGQEVSVWFAAKSGAQPGQIANRAIISGAGETFTRAATVEVRVPTYLPSVLR